MPDTKYYYCMQYRAVGAVVYSNCWIFISYARAQGSTYTFTIEADEHLYDKKVWTICIELHWKNEAAG